MPTASPSSPPNAPPTSLPIIPPANIEPLWPRGLNWPTARISSSTPRSVIACCTAWTMSASDIGAPSRRRKHAPSVEGEALQIGLRLDVGLALHAERVGEPDEAGE